MLEQSGKYFKTDGDRQASAYLDAYVYTVLRQTAEAEKARATLKGLLAKGARSPRQSISALVRFVDECESLNDDQRRFLRDLNSEWRKAHGDR